jgi:hypothetical protein
VGSRATPLLVRISHLLPIFAIGLAGACGDSLPGKVGDANPDAAIDTPATPVGDILDELRAIPGLTAEEETALLEGYRFFVLAYEQPVDHNDPAGAKFTQRMTLLFRDYAAPMVVYNSGYFVSTNGYPAGITVLTDANQLSMEYRYFGPSRPEPAEWTKLDIWQAATDQHRITEALQARLFKANWLTTGASKGGMTSLFHRRFYPDDVNGTVAYVAPLDYPDDQIQSPTNRYINFLENVGTDATCRQKLKDFQNLVLARRAAIKTRMQTKATYTVPLDADHALEFAVEELPFIFWQYGDQSKCSDIPPSDATDDSVFEFFDETINVASYGDEQLAEYLPYYHQSATQLSYPIDDESYLVGLMYPGADTARSYIPPGVTTPAYDDGAAMTDVQSWIATSGSKLLLIYGENDPWTAGAIDLGDATDSFKFIVPGGNHGANISALDTTERDTARNAIMRWMGLAQRSHGIYQLPSLPTAEQMELAHRPRL